MRHVREGRDVVLAWGDRAGAHPSDAPAALRFDADRAVAQLDALYALDVHDLGVADEDGAIADHKVVVVVDGTWSDGPGSSTGEVVVPLTGGLSQQPRGATGSVVDGVGLLRVDVSALTARGHESATATAGGRPRSAARSSTRRGSWPGGSPRWCRASRPSTRPVGGFASDDAATFWSASAAYLATVAAPGGIGDAADLVRSPQLHWSSPRLGDGSWLLLQYLAERDGEQLLGELWRDAQAGEDPLSAYKRLTGLTQADLNRRVAEYALRTVTWDFTDRSAITAAVAGLDPVLLADRTTPVESVEGDPGHYRVLDAFAPSDYGFTIVRLTPDAGVTDVHLRLRGHGEAADAGLSFGFVALRGGTPRYSPVTESLDQEVQFTLRAGEQELYLVVAGTPTRAPRPRLGRRVRRRGPVPVRVPAVGRDRRGRRVPARDGRWSPARRTGAAGWTTPRPSTRRRSSAPTPWCAATRRCRANARIEGRAWVEAGAVVERGRGRAGRRGRPVRRTARRDRRRRRGRGRGLHVHLRGVRHASTPRAACDGRPATPGRQRGRRHPSRADDLALSGVAAPAPTAEPTPEPTQPPATPHADAHADEAAARSAADPGTRAVEPEPHRGRSRAPGAHARERLHGRLHGHQPLVVGGPELVPGAGRRHRRQHRGGGLGRHVGHARGGADLHGVERAPGHQRRSGDRREHVLQRQPAARVRTATFGFQGTAPGDAGQLVPQVSCTRTR